jgi:hypothetical protein
VFTKHRDRHAAERWRLGAVLLKVNGPHSGQMRLCLKDVPRFHAL